MKEVVFSDILAKRWPRASTSSGRDTPSSGRTSRRSASAPATPVGGATAEPSSLASICKKWKSQQAIPWAEVRKKTKKRKRQVQVSELFVEEKCSPAVLVFLRSTGVGRTVPSEDGENEEEDQDGASESSGAED